MKFNRFFTILAASALLLTTAGCIQQEAPLSPLQKRQMSTRLIEGRYDDVFAATMTIVQDHEYILKQTNKDTGLITAEVNKDAGFASKFFTSNKYGYTSNSGTKVELSVVVSKINATKSEVRLSIEEKVYNSNGGTTSSRQLYDMQTFSTLLNDITTEVKRREALGR